jgi:hypothetical protein
MTYRVGSEARKKKAGRGISESSGEDKARSRRRPERECVPVDGLLASHGWQTARFLWVVLWTIDWCALTLLPHQCH